MYLLYFRIVKFYPFICERSLLCGICIAEYLLCPFSVFQPMVLLSRQNQVAVPVDAKFSDNVQLTDYTAGVSPDSDDLGPFIHSSIGLVKPQRQ